jgi:hypothetical protein
MRGSGKYSEAKYLDAMLKIYKAFYTIVWIQTGILLCTINKSREIVYSKHIEWLNIIDVL